MENSMEEGAAVLYTSSFWSPFYRLGDKALEAEKVFCENAVTCFPYSYTLAWHLVSASICDWTLG